MAVVAAVTAVFDLQRRMVDAETLIQHLEHLVDEMVVIPRLRPNQVRGQRDLARAERPDVQVVHHLHARPGGEEGLDFVLVDPARHRVHGRFESVAQQPERTPDHDRAGPAGYVSMEDGAVGGFVQRGVAAADGEHAVVEMGGTSTVEPLRGDATATRSAGLVGTVETLGLTMNFAVWVRRSCWTTTVC